MDKKNLIESNMFNDRIHSVSYNDLLSCINVIPALFWKIEITKNRIEYMNSFELPGLNEKSTLLLKNMVFSRKVIVEQDFYIFENLMKAVRDRKSCVSIFRIRLSNGTIHWLKIAGGPDPYHSTSFVGYIMEINDVLDSVKVLDNKGEGLAGEINLFVNPVLLSSISDRRIIAANSAAIETLGFGEDEIRSKLLEDVFRGNLSQHMIKVYEEILFYKRWNGALSFSGKDNKIYTGEVAIRAVTEGVDRFLWISIYDIIEESRLGGDDLLLRMDGISFQDSSISAEIKDAASRGDMGAILQILLDHQPSGALADSILFSDVHEEKGVVYTYGVGPSFESLQPSESYPYEGTIAENIKEYNLENIIVEDTFQSIKPIDWALFIPQNVKSYYARPFYEGGDLKTVIVFCSQKCSVFDKENVKAYGSLFPLFLEGLKIWRQAD